MKDQQDRQNKKIIHWVFLFISILVLTAGWAFIKLGEKLKLTEITLVFSYIIIVFSILGILSSIIGLFRNR